MEKFLEKYNLPKLNQKEIENLNKSTTKWEIETNKKNLPTNKSPGLDGEIFQKFRDINTYPTQTLTENCRGRKIPKLILQGQHYPVTKSRQRCHI